MLTEFLTNLRTHKIRTGIILLVILVGGYYGYKKINPTVVPNRYVWAAVQKGTLITSVSGSGQIIVSNQVDVKAKASGEVTAVLVKAGQEVKAGQTLVQLDARDAYKSVRDAQANLESAKLALAKLQQPADSLSVLESENSLAQAQEAKTKAQDAIDKTYDDAFNTISNTFLNLPTIMTQLRDTLYSSDISIAESSVGGTQWNISTLFNTTDQAEKIPLTEFQKSAESDYENARKLYDINFADYKSAGRYSEQAAIEKLLNQTVETVRSIAQAAKSESNYLDTWVDYRTAHGRTTFAKVTTYQTSLSTSIGQTNTSLASLLALQNSLKDNRTTIINSDRTIAEKTGSLEKLKSGTDALDLQSQELAVKQRQNALFDAQEKLSDYSVRAPFAGVIAKSDLKRGDSLSTGGTAVTLITTQRMAQISLNEVDVAKIAVGQKVTLTFDAIEGLGITGEVADIDTLGTVSQGVVTYNVKITFDTQDERVKPGMSVSAAIITNVKQDILLVSNSAVKAQGNSSYVEMLAERQTGSPDPQGVLSASPLQQKSVQVGLSNDTSTEIVSGLSEGDQIVVRTITPTVTSASTAPSLLGGGGNRGGGGGGIGGVRIPGR